MTNKANPAALDPATVEPRVGSGYPAPYAADCAKREKRRLGDADMSPLDPRMLRNRIVHGIVVEWGVAFAVAWAFGPAAFFAYLLQAFIAVRLLEAVNYFEHWGLVRTGRRVRPVDSWDTHSWFTYYGLIGLSRHADHHAYPSRPYQQLRVWDQAPVLPVGYVGLVDMVIARNDEFRRVATDELRARGLGPFADGARPAPVAEPERGLAARIGAVFGRLPAAARPALVAGLVLLGSALGVWLEGGSETSFGHALGRNGLILAIFAGVLVARHRIDRSVQNGWISWGAALVLLFVIGVATRPLLG